MSYVRVAAAARSPVQAGVAVALCAFAAIFEGFDLQAPGVTAPILGPIFSMSPGDRGLFLSMSTFGLMFGAIIGGRLSDRVGRKSVLVASILLFGALSIATAFAPDVKMLLVARFFTGVGLGGALPNLIALASESVQPERRNSAVGFLLAGPPIGGALASLVAAYASASGQWQLVYYVGGFVPVLLIAPVLAFALKEQRPDPAGARAGAGDRPPIAAALFGEGRAPITLALWVGFFAVLLVLFMLLGWLPSLMVSRGLARSDASLVQMAFNLVAIPGSIAAGALLDRSGRPALTVALIFLSAGLALAFIAAAPGTLAVSLIAGGLAGATVTGSQTLLYAVAPTCYPGPARGTGMGFCVAAGRFGSAAGPIVAGFLVGAGRSPAQVLGALLPITALAALATMFVTVAARRASTVRREAELAA